MCERYIYASRLFPELGADDWYLQGVDDAERTGEHMGVYTAEGPYASRDEAVAAAPEHAELLGWSEYRLSVDE